jgi:solute carrier family 39 (zinc transporter), member 1/2/3
LSIFAIFIVELVAFRWGTTKLAKLGVHHGQSTFVLSFSDAYTSSFLDAHGHRGGSHAAHGPEGILTKIGDEEVNFDVENLRQHDHDSISDSASGKIIGVAILEFGVLLHR